MGYSPQCAVEGYEDRYALERVWLALGNFDKCITLSILWLALPPPYPALLASMGVTLDRLHTFAPGPLALPIRVGSHPWVRCDLCRRFIPETCRDSLGSSDL